MLAFWRQITGSNLSERRGSAGEFATLLPGTGDPYLRVQDVGGDRAGCHLDVHVEDIQEDRARAASCGAVVVEDLGTHVVLASPAGFEFCLVTHRGEQVRPLPVRWPDGHQSLVDQLCVDVLSDLFDDEVQFWAALTGWQQRSGARPEFVYLERPAGVPLRLMFQRLGTAELSRPVGAHLDLASDDQNADLTEHLRLGATLIRRVENWARYETPPGASTASPVATHQPVASDSGRNRSGRAAPRHRGRRRHATAAQSDNWGSARRRRTRPQRAAFSFRVGSARRDELAEMSVVVVHRWVIGVGEEERQEGALTVRVGQQQVAPGPKVRMRDVRGGLFRSQAPDRLHDSRLAQPVDRCGMT